jgi:hypothetical protein
LNASGCVGLKFRDGFIDNNRHIFLSRVTGCVGLSSRGHYPHSSAAAPSTASAIFYCISRAATTCGPRRPKCCRCGRRLGVHGFQADAARSIRARPVPGRQSAGASPLPKITSSASKCVSRSKCTALSCSKCCIPPSIRSPAGVMTTLWKIFSAPLAPSPGRNRDGLWEPIWSGCNFHGWVVRRSDQQHGGCSKRCLQYSGPTVVKL